VGIHRTTGRAWWPEIKEAIMSRLGNCAALACASLTFAAGMVSAASASEECSQLYKICNWSCDRTTNAVDNFLICKGQCDRRLIACDRRSINASTLGGRPLPGLTPQGNDRSMAD
jgi:sugar (pentulose or hexulose) kinase